MQRDRRLFNLHITIIYHGFTTAPWYCGRNVGYSHTLNSITGVMVYNYNKYVWLSYSMCAFILNVFRLFFIQIGYLFTIVIFLPWY